MPIIKPEQPNPDVIARRALNWFAGPASRVITEDHGLVSVIVATTPTHMTVLAWRNASRDEVVKKLKMAANAVAQGSRKIKTADVISFELEYQDQHGGLWLPS